MLTGLSAKEQGLGYETFLLLTNNRKHYEVVEGLKIISV
jgi:hypothetical protein